MCCPSELKTALLDILYWTMLEVRSNTQDELYCFALSDHAHNIPELIDKYSPDLLFYYWESERPRFLSELERQNREPRQPFKQQWDIIASIHERIRAVTHIVPAIIIEPVSGLTDIAKTEEDLLRHLDSKCIAEFRILDQQCTERLLTLSVNGDYRCETKGADLEEIRRLLLMFGASCEVFDPTELMKSKYAADMFDAYLTQAET